MFENLQADFRAARADRVLETGWLRVLIRIETPAVICYRFSHWALKLRVPVVRQILLIISMIMQRFVQMFIGVFISPDAEIGPGLLVHTPYGILVGPVKIGANCTIQNGVVITASARGIGDNVYFGPGAKVMGEAKIGSNVNVMANSVVLTDVPDNTTVMGVPARIRLPRSVPRRFKWQTVEEKSAQPQPANGQPVTKAKT
jgi:serine O-acetyltransferase